jgi:hypothetical protein
MVALIATVSGAQERPTHEIHSAMLYNFVKYVQWPNEGDAGSFVVGVLGDDNVYNTLKQWYEGKPRGSKKYEIRKLGSAAEAGSCQVVYLGKSKNRDFGEVQSSVTGKSILTITDGNGMGEKGSCINFRVINGKLKFEINQATVSSSNLKVSTQLSSMAILI